MKPLAETLLPQKGQYVGFNTIIDNARFMAYVWSDRDRRFFIASAGSMAKGKPQERIHWRETGDKDGNREANRVHVKLPIPRASEIYFDACGAIDQHNRVRKMAGIDKRFRTNDWAI